MKTYILLSFFFLFCINCSAQNINYETKSFLDSNKTKRYDVKVEYPQIIKYGDASAQDKINKIIQSEILNIKDEFLKDINDFDLSSVPKEFSSSFESNYEMYYSGDNIFSFTYEIFQYAAGSAHPYYYSKAMNFNLNKIKQIDFSDFFKNGEADLKFISEYCYADLKKQAKENDYEFYDETLREGTEPTAGNFENICIKPEGLYVIFNPYQVAAYAAGQQFVTIPYSKLTNIINPEGSLKIFIK